jgi:hypothetical protein
MNGLQSSYQTNQPISFTLNGVQLPSNKPADSQDGFNVQASVPNVNGVNGSYNSVTGLWNVTIPGPSTVGTYTLTTFLYCAGGSCSTQYTNAASQVIKSFTFTVTAAPITQPIAPTVTISANPTTVIVPVPTVGKCSNSSAACQDSVSCTNSGRCSTGSCGINNCMVPGQFGGCGGTWVPGCSGIWTPPSSAMNTQTSGASNQTAIISQSLQGLLNQLGALLKSL